jgi:hypothetical protein
MRRMPLIRAGVLFALLPAIGLASAANARASELVTLKNGFDVICDHRESVGDRIRLYTSPGSSNFVEFGTSEIAAIQPGPLPAAPLDTAPAAGVSTSLGDPQNTFGDKTGSKPTPPLTAAELHQMLATAGTQHNIDVDLLASVVHAESGGNAHALSRAGARGLMQLMPGTAAQLGVIDSFRPEENIRGGADYLNSLLVKYRDNLAFALAAYNAGPAAVARWHGVPPYRETRAYVARIIREFNARRPSTSVHAGTLALAIKAPHREAQLLASR